MQKILTKIKYWAISFWHILNAYDKVWALILFLSTVLMSFELPEYTYIIHALSFLISLVAISIQATKKVNLWLRKQAQDFFSKKRLFIYLGLLTADVLFVVWIFNLSGETIYQTDVIQIILEIIINSLVAVTIVLPLPLFFMVLYSIGEVYVKFSKLPDKIIDSIKRSESHIYRQPLHVLRTFLFFLVTITIFSMWFGISTYKRLSAIELTLGGKQSLGCSFQDTVELIRPSIVRIVGGLGEGSGFAVSQHYIVTNHHVIDGEPSPKIVYQDGSFENGTVVAADYSRDLATIRVDRDLEPLKWVSWGTTQLGQTLLVFGYPYGGSLNGQVTVNRATIAAFRGKRGQDDAQYVQTDGGVIDGMSGGPMVTLCGQAVAVNAAGSENMGLGIDADTAQNWIYSATSDNPTNPWQEQEIPNPDVSALDAVKTYYGYLSARNYKAAYEMLSDNFIGEVEYDNWAAGFGTQLQTSVLSIKIDPTNRWRVFVELGSTDLVDGDIVYHRFEGSWIVRKIDGHLRLWESNIKEVYDL